jgi:hypothetical protein
LWQIKPYHTQNSLHYSPICIKEVEKSLDNYPLKNVWKKPTLIDGVTYDFSLHYSVSRLSTKSRNLIRVSQHAEIARQK